MRPPMGTPNTPGSVLARATQDREFRTALLDGGADTQRIVAGLNVLHGFLPGITNQVFRLVDNGETADAITQKIDAQVVAFVGKANYQDCMEGLRKALVELVKAEVIEER